MYFFIHQGAALAFIPVLRTAKKSNITGHGQLKNSTDTLITMIHWNKKIRNDLKKEVGCNQFI